MLRRGEFWLVLLVSAAIVGAALMGQWMAPSGDLFDFRRSAMLNGPDGAKGFAKVIEELHVDVELRQRPLFDLMADSSTFAAHDVLALLDMTHLPTDEEQRTLRNSVAQGRSLFLAGSNGVERCFAYRVVFVGNLDTPMNKTVVRPSGVDSLPLVEYVVERIPNDSMEQSDEPTSDCPVLLPTSTDTLLSLVDGQTVALRLRFRQGGTVTILADSWLLANQSLKETDAGLLVIPWILAGEPHKVIIDEYHHGFQDRQSIFVAAWQWLLASPGGWTLLQLSIAAVAGLVLMSIRFGPALTVIERKRRSAVEHLDALAVGLERAEGRSTAVALIAGGLRRRLTRTGTLSRGGNQLNDWLAKLSLAVHTSEARKKVKRLAWLVREPGGDEQVLGAATAVEDVWEALGQRNKPN
jgi:hypothetical protein